ncbi:angiopoietin-related protein 3-like [Denticeps clupeoides]|uniref:angiopoietin-related protein 3-like n=1 Tax=Denticeps clupeoides TaxID=299321 RepID=UPI0010A41152|nr:angiopoietin-related protein 3-like [Denticeps clupeoides]
MRRAASLLLLVALAHALPTKDGKTAEDADVLPPTVQAETRSRFAPLDDVRLLANGLLQLGHSLRDFVQKTKGQIQDIFQKLSLFDRSFYQLSILTSEIKEEEEELKKTTVILKTSNEEIRNLSQEISSRMEDIVRERRQLRGQVGGLEDKLSGLSQGLLSPQQLAEISALKELISSQEQSITDLLKAVKDQSDQLNSQRNQIKILEKKLKDPRLQETAVKIHTETDSHNSTAV